jgi:hypothetical protein
MINFVKTENSFNKLLKRGVKYAEDVKILFTSPYDKMSQTILNEVEKGNHTLDTPLNVVSSFDTPHAFVAYKTTQVPCLVSIKNRKKYIQYYVPLIYDEVGIAS